MMSQPVMVLILVVAAALIFAAMWFGWRARRRRSAGITTSGSMPNAEIIARFSSVTYVSTTPAEAPFERVVIPGLSYRGNADLTVHRDGVSIAVAGEAPVSLARERIDGCGEGAARVGKAVEAGGLAILAWHSGAERFESSFRFVRGDDQQAFARAIASMLDDPFRPTGEPPTTPPIQEDA